MIHNGPAQIGEVPSEEVVGPFNPNQFLFVGGLSDYCFNGSLAAVRVASTLDKQFGLGAVGQVAQLARICRKAHTDERLDARMAAAGPHSDPGSKGEARQKDGFSWELFFQLGERGAHVAGFSSAGIMFALAESSTAEVEAQHRSPGARLQDLGNLVDDLVVEGAAIERVRMADQPSHRTGVGMCGKLEQGLETSCGAGDEQ
jgi:hypothetical protein